MIAPTSPPLTRFLVIVLAFRIGVEDALDAMDEKKAAAGGNNAGGESVGGLSGVVRKRGSSAMLSGGDGLAYAEFARDKGGEAGGGKKKKDDKTTGKNALFNARNKDKKEQKRLARKNAALEE
jgi:hypothetical protein